ncbi:MULTISPECIES: molybdopterin-dependent oxidoreductase [unclassified Sphingomonas]|uniref:molybdopterin-dependent oxidoreductase n=1 Tax=unclassified Sphingomonas TaxID=196159 RepID=UPI00226A5C1D|nr:MULTISPECIES: molybdopterin-dependent oxidoreductase [unclassified Sphingomonas]
MIERSPDPYNAEPEPGALIERFLTPQALFYVRSHGPVPDLPADHRIEVSGIGLESRSLSVEELKSAFPTHTVTAVLQCAGNRRTDLQQVGKTSGDPWDVGAIGNAEWTGVRLADVLNALCAPDADDLFVAFTGADEVAVEGEEAPFGVSIAMAKARAPDVLLAWAMNGEPLAPEHGAPLRMVVPGYAGVRSAKWLTRIEVRDTPSDAPIQAHDYKLFPADVTSKTVDWSQGLTIEAMPLNAAICSPGSGDSLPAGEVRIEGYAIAYDRGISRVEVSVNGGRDWRQATFAGDPEARWGWRRWSLDSTLAKGRQHLVVRAFDDAGQGQPERPDTMWNFAGYLCTAWHHVHVLVE